MFSELGIRPQKLHTILASNWYCMQCFDPRSTVLVSKSAFILQKSCHTILKMSYSDKIYEKNGKIPSLFGQESSFSIVCNFFARRGSTLNAIF